MWMSHSKDRERRLCKRGCQLDWVVNSLTAIAQGLVDGKIPRYQRANKFRKIQASWFDIIEVTLYLGEIF